MSYILAATDFSDAADHALQYACALGKAIGLPVQLLHTYLVMPPVSSVQDMPMPLMDMRELDNIAQEQTAKALKALQMLHPDLQLSAEVIYGDFVDVLNDLAKERPPMLAVIGNSGSSDEAAWLRSNGLSALRSATVPVLSVPPGVLYEGVSTLLLCCDDYDLQHPLEVSVLLELKKVTGASLQLLHAGKAPEAADAFLQSPLHTVLQTAKPAYRHIVTEHVDEGLRDFAAGLSKAWLCLVPHRHSFFYDLFHKSHTEHLLHQSRLPVLALHEWR